MMNYKNLVEMNLQQIYKHNKQYLNKEKKNVNKLCNKVKKKYQLIKYIQED